MAIGNITLHFSLEEKKKQLEIEESEKIKETMWLQVNLNILKPD